MRRSSLFAVSVAIAVMVAVGSAGAQTSGDPIRPGQIFNGFVNGSLKDATIKMACGATPRPGALGHPAAGQTLEVARGLDLQPSGFTGRTSRISVDMRLRRPVPHTVHLADFSTYATVALPTSITIPCAGSGDVVFSPFHGGPSARSVAIHVLLVNQP